MPAYGIIHYWPTRAIQTFSRNVIGRGPYRRAWYNTVPALLSLATTRISVVWLADDRLALLCLTDVTILCHFRLFDVTFLLFTGCSCIGEAFLTSWSFVLFVSTDVTVVDPSSSWTFWNVSIKYPFRLYSPGRSISITLTCFLGGTGKYQALGQIRALASSGTYMTSGLVFPCTALKTG